MRVDERIGLFLSSWGLIVFLWRLMDGLMVGDMPEDLFFFFGFEVFLFENLNVADEHFMSEFLLILEGFSQQGDKLSKLILGMLCLI